MSEELGPAVIRALLAALARRDGRDERLAVVAEAERHLLVLGQGDEHLALGQAAHERAVILLGLGLSTAEAERTEEEGGSEKHHHIHQLHFQLLHGSLLMPLPDCLLDFFFRRPDITAPDNSPLDPVVLREEEGHLPVVENAPDHRGQALEFKLLHGIPHCKEQSLLCSLHFLFFFYSCLIINYTNLSQNYDFLLIISSGEMSANSHPTRERTI